MTILHPVTGWTKFTQLYGSPTTFCCQEIFDSIWLSQYPRKKKIGMDNGGEFQRKLTDFCDNMGLKKKEQNSWNPQSNAILEQIHQVLSDSLRVFDLEIKKMI